MGLPLLLWYVLRRTAFVGSLLAVGDHDATSFSAGVNVEAVRIWAYSLGGLLAAVGGIALTGLIRSADAQVFNGYVLAALAAVALGGTNLAGGRGGLLASAVGATCIFLLDNLLAALHVSSQYVQVAYGGALLLAVVDRLAPVHPTATRHMTDIDLPPSVGTPRSRPALLANAVAWRRLAVDTPALQIVSLLVLFVVTSMTIDGFVAKSSIYSALVLAAFLGIAASGQTIVILIGGIDLSVPAVIGAANLVSPMLGAQGWSFGLVVLFVVAVGARSAPSTAGSSGAWACPR